MQKPPHATDPPNQASEVLEVDTRERTKTGLTFRCWNYTAVYHTVLYHTVLDSTILSYTKLYYLTSGFGVTI